MGIVWVVGGSQPRNIKHQTFPLINDQACLISIFLKSYNPIKNVNDKQYIRRNENDPIECHAKSYSGISRTARESEFQIGREIIKPYIPPTQRVC